MISSGGSGARPRPSGGMNAGLGQFTDEHLEANAMQQAVSQKQASQQSTSQQQTVTSGQGGDKAAQDFLANQMQGSAGQKFGSQGQGGGMPGLGGLPGQAGQAGQSGKAGQKPGQSGRPGATTGQPKKPPRPLGSLADELIKRPAKDIASGLWSHFNIAEILGINPATDTPEEQAKKKQIHQRWNKLNQEDQEYVKRKYQEGLQKKKAQEEEEHRRQQLEEQKKQEQPLVSPSGSRKGPIGPSGSRKQRAVTKLELDRKTLGGPASAN